MVRSAALLFTLTVVVAALPAAPAAAADYSIDSARSTLLVRVWKEGPASAFAHDHVARASKLSGTVRWDPAKPNAGAVEVQVETAGLMMHEPNVRRRLEMPALPDVNRREI